MNAIKSAPIAPRQIVYLELLTAEAAPQRLYAETIDVMPQQQRCWARPLMLAQWAELDGPEEAAIAPLANPRFGRPDFGPDFDSSHPTDLSDLTDGPDLLWPSNLFQVALDTDVIPLLIRLQASTSPSDPDRSRQLVNQFTRQFWSSR